MLCPLLPFLPQVARQRGPWDSGLLHWPRLRLSVEGETEVLPGVLYTELGWRLRWCVEQVTLPSSAWKPICTSN